MKKILYSVMALAIAAMTFTACEDVPEPYPTPTPTDGSKAIEGAEGDGTLANPFNAIAATNAAKELGSGNVSEQMYYIKGKVVSIAIDSKTGNVLNYDQGTYGNATFYISDDGTSTNQFYCYRVLYLGNKKWTQGAGDILKVGDDVIVCAKITMYNTTPETQQNEGFLYSLNGKSEGGAPAEEETGTPAGDGSQANPFNVAAAIAKCKEIGDSPSTEKYYVKGIAVTEGIPDASFGNATFDMADTADGTSKFKAFQVLGTNGVKMPTTCKIPVGAEVIVYGPIYNYKNNTPETEGKGAAYIVSVNGKSTEELNGGGNTPDTPTGEAKGSGTEADPYNAIAAIQYAQTLGADQESENDIYVTGIISSIKYTYSSQYGTATYNISVDGKAANEFIVYGSYYLNNQPWKDGDTQIQVGDEVVVCGKVVNYKGDTPEFANKKNWLISIKSNGGNGGGGNEGGGGEVSGNTLSVDFSSLGLSNQQKPSTLTLTDGTTLAFDAGGNTNAPAYYNTGTALRMYPKNTMAINAGSKKIVAIEIVCDEYQGTLYNASGDITANDTKMTIDGTSLKYTGPNASTATIANTSSTTGAASQLRMKTLKITYAE